MKPQHRARLLDLAARRGEKGFSSLVAEALETFFESMDQQERRRAIALRLRGCLAPHEADGLRRAVSGVVR